MLEGRELKTLDIRHANRMPTRAAAVRKPLRRGLAAVGYAVRGMERTPALTE